MPSVQQHSTKIFSPLLRSGCVLETATGINLFKLEEDPDIPFGAWGEIAAQGSGLEEVFQCVWDTRLGRRFFEFLASVISQENLEEKLLPPTITAYLTGLAAVSVDGVGAGEEKDENEGPMEVLSVQNGQIEEEENEEYLNTSLIQRWIDTEVWSGLMYFDSTPTASGVGIIFSNLAGFVSGLTNGWSDPAALLLGLYTQLPHLRYLLPGIAPTLRVALRDGVHCEVGRYEDLCDKAEAESYILPSIVVAPGIEVGTSFPLNGVEYQEGGCLRCIGPPPLPIILAGMLPGADRGVAS